MLHTQATEQKDLANQMMHLQTGPRAKASALPATEPMRVSRWRHR